MDADKEGFLRSETSLVQTIGRAARNVEGQVVMYADQVTDSMQRAISETNRRRKIQIDHNEKHGINPQTIRKAVTDILAMIRPETPGAPVPGANKRSRSMDSQRRIIEDSREMPEAQLQRLILTLEDEMSTAAGELRFEYAARLRDEIRELKRDLRDIT